MRISKSVLIISLAALVLVAAGYLLGQVFPANTATADVLYYETTLDGKLKIAQGDYMQIFVDGAQRMVYCGYYGGCSARGVTIKIDKRVHKQTGKVSYSFPK